MDCESGYRASVCETERNYILEDAKALVANGCIAVAEAQICRLQWKPLEYLQASCALFAPGEKTVNAGGVAIPHWRCPSTANV